jgi:putative transposase
VNPSIAPGVKDALLARWEPMYRSQLHYLVTWNTRGRRPVLRDRHVHVLEGLIQQACDERGYALLETVAGPDRVHMLVGLRPAASISSVVREIKGKTGMALLAQHPELRVWLRGNLVWDERYAVETVSPQRIERVRERLRNLHSRSDELARAS